MQNSKKKNPRTLQNTYIIPVMGPTGAGKSTFINSLLQKDVAPVGHSLNSCTSELQAIEIPFDIVKTHIDHWDDKNKLIIVDTPGFDDTSADDTEILKRIANWLSASYADGIRLAGIIYLHDICQRRVTGATKRNFQVFDELCGQDACKSVVLGTTQWSRISKSDEQNALDRHNQLGAQFWNGMIKNGSRLFPLREPSTSSSWTLVNAICNEFQSDCLLQIQDELNNLEKTLPQTQAAQVLRKNIEDLIRSLKNAGGEKKQIAALVKEVEALKIQVSFFTKLKGFFGLRRK